MLALEASMVCGVDSCVSGTQRTANPRMTTELEWWFDDSIWPGPDRFEGFPVGTVVCYRLHGMANVVGVVTSSSHEITAVLEDSRHRVVSTSYRTEDLIAFIPEPGEPLAT